ncbi:MAG: hypothetical protein KUG69_01725 [Marinosulfonomonas sp.]|nr:hypothetical protein [Marinosulfonomonas sp.]
MTLKIASASSLWIALLLSPVMAQTQHDMSSHTDQMSHTSVSAPGQINPGPQEPGQGAFAAIAEIVKILGNDPATDWSRVNITALRDHLLDMDLLITDTQVVTTPIAGGLEMSVSAAGASGRMVPAHGPVLAGETGWTSSQTRSGDTVIWRVTSPNDEAKIRALGFFGLMATGDHHRAHHLAMATGASPH